MSDWVVISGSRSWTTAALVTMTVDRLVARGASINVGDAPYGVDRFVLRRLQQLTDEGTLDRDRWQVWKADWEHEGKVAGHRRNERMVIASSDLIALFAAGRWTPGTVSATSYALRKGISVHIFHDGAWYDGASLPETLRTAVDRVRPSKWFLEQIGASA
jgi:hypothetical protein